MCVWSLVRKIPWRRKWQSIPVFLPWESHGQRSLEGYSPRSHKESDTTEHMPIILGDTLFKNIFDWIKVKYDFFFYSLRIMWISFLFSYFTFFLKFHFQASGLVSWQRVWKYSVLYFPGLSTTQTFRLFIFLFLFFLTA